MLVVPVAAYMPKGAVGGTITTVFGPASFNTTDSGYGSYTEVVVFNVGTLSAASGAPKIRISVSYSRLDSGVVVTAYIGQSTGTNNISFTGDQVQLKWAGAGSFTSGGSILNYTSDFVTLAQNFDNTKAYSVAIQNIGTGVSLNRGTLSGATGVYLYYKSGSDAATTSKSGYTLLWSNTAQLVTEIDVST